MLLERVLRGASRWKELTALFKKRIAAASLPQDQAAAHAAAGRPSGTQNTMVARTRLVLLGLGLWSLAACQPNAAAPTAERKGLITVLDLPAGR